MTPTNDPSAPIPDKPSIPLCPSHQGGIDGDCVTDDALYWRFVAEIQAKYKYGPDPTFDSVESRWSETVT